MKGNKEEVELFEERAGLEVYVRLYLEKTLHCDTAVFETCNTSFTTLAPAEELRNATHEDCQTFRS